MTRKLIPPNQAKMLEEYIQLNWQHDKAIMYLSSLIDGDSPMDSEITKVIRILEGEER